MSLTPAHEPPSRELVPYEGDAPIRVGMSSREQLETRWGLILVVYMRLLACLWALQGLREWSMFMLPRDSLFDRLSTGQTSAVMYFAVIDLLAAVGLWLATPWGGVLWLFAAVSQIFVSIAVEHAFTKAWLGVDLVLVALYFGLTWQASRFARDR